MRQNKEAHELYQYINGIVHGGAPRPAGIFGPFGINRGLREELLKQSGKIAGKISSSTLTDQDIEEFLGLCRVSQAGGVMSKSDMNKIQLILKRSKQ